MKEIVQRDFGIAENSSTRFYTRELASHYGQNIEIHPNAWRFILPKINTVIVAVVQPVSTQGVRVVEAEYW